MEFRERDDGGGLPAEVDHLVRLGRIRAGSRLHTHMATVPDNDVADPTAWLRSRMTTAGSWTSSSRRGFILLGAPLGGDREVLLVVNAQARTRSESGSGRRCLPVSDPAGARGPPRLCSRSPSPPADRRSNGKALIARIQGRPTGWSGAVGAGDTGEARIESNF